ncbi:MAG: hypothetical protein V8R08_00940 [Coriobacteriales bacterium]
MFDYESEIKTPLDTIDALGQMSSTLRGLGFMSIALCEERAVADEDTFGLIADIVYHCARIGEKASEVICANIEEGNRWINAQDSLTPKTPLNEQAACAA